MCLPTEERGRCITPTPCVPQPLFTIKEPGLYRLIPESRKPKVERFKTLALPGRAAAAPQVRLLRDALCPTRRAHAGRPEAGTGRDRRHSPSAARLFSLLCVRMAAMSDEYS